MKGEEKRGEMMKRENGGVEGPGLTANPGSPFSQAQEFRHPAVS
jgi:hypothetical protein